MTCFNDIEPGMIFYTKMKNNFMIAKKIDIQSLPLFFIDGDKIKLPIEEIDSNQFSVGAQKYRGFNYQVLFLAKEIYQFGYMHGDENVEVISPNKLEKYVTLFSDSN